MTKRKHQPKYQDLKDISCPTCSSSSFVSFRTRDYNRQVDDQEFVFYRCPNCNTQFLHPIPQDLGRYYPPEYYTIPTSVAELTLRAEVDRHKIDILTKYSSPGRLCEIGPACGYFSFLAKQAGYSVEVIEMDSRCAHFLREVVGIPVANTVDAVSALETMAPYDVIALWHVVEHLPNPWPTLLAAFRRLLPGGILIVAAPNPEAFQFKIFGGRWTHVDAPRHVQLIPIKLLEQRLSEAGMALVHVTTSDPAAIGWNRFGWEFTLKNFARRHRIRRCLAGIGRVASRILSPVERRKGCGSAYTMVFRKIK